ncbi:MAG: hypothetical protein PHD15_02900 [Clostridia bacterium]|nr:hypothetical protein [Clostridia bacterium]MDD4386693.1 hypothetical protein [Clostridia bacterium]
METMRFRETKKASYKGQIFFIILFLLIGVTITYFAICTEKEPTLIGQSGSDIVNKSNLDESNALTDVEEPLNNASELYKITNNYISDKTIKKIKANITIPVISINDEVLTTINDQIYNKFNNTYNSFKKTMENVDNNFTYTVTYKVYDNIIAEKNVISITIYERMIDDSAKVNSMEKIYTYNINQRDGMILKQEDVILDILSSTYKDKIKIGIKNYVISNCNIKESEYNYSYTGLETFYIEENKIHFIFNPEVLVDKKYSILDITI